MFGSVYGYSRCDWCGISVVVTQLESGEHTCIPEHVAAHQTKELPAELERFLAEPWAQSHLAFATWEREHR